MFTIGNYNIHGCTTLAPMAGVTDLPFRQLCSRYGAGLTTTEMVTSDIRLWKSNKSRQRLRATATAGSPLSVQIAGSDPEMLAEAAQQCVKVGAKIVDINMGCPAKKVCKKLAGSALLKDENLVIKILQAVVAAVSVPVTLKTRTGWDTENKNVGRIAHVAEDIGIAAITIHGRTRACKFAGEAEYDSIAEVVQRVGIPVLANGDINCGEKARKVLEYTGAQAVVVGRAALGKPWVFSQINQFVNNKEYNSAPSAREIKSVMIEHVQNLHGFYGELQGVKIARKHVGWYCQHLPGGNLLRKQFNQSETPISQIRTITQHFEQLNTYEEKAA